ncbi:MAG: AAA family ATPase [Methylobacter sp.]|uniref:AAA family ATPase n=1 Tax=Methylobacter sp. TaxID=2051955 RepID=UPI0027317D85|nr:AAA family ATPase [Methylobacter sp.]MDP1667355.1 AAA family ATPase [Methylobacter sp.]
MKIDYLEVRSRFKNLENVRVDFDDDSLMTVIVGRNGSGKSNVVEALVAIFRNLDLGEAPPFAYEIRYKLGMNDKARWITVDADPSRGTLSKQYDVKVSKSASNNDLELAQPVSITKVERDKKGVAEYLPKYLFAYYSGPSDRLENYFRKHRTDFYRKLLKSEVDLKGDIRPLFYAKPFHSQFVLLAFFLSSQDDKEKIFLREQLGIEGLDSVHFVMRKTSWVTQPEELFWGAKGVVREFLDKLFPYALAPVKVTRPENTSLTGKGRKNEFFHLFLPDVESLREFAQGLSPDVFFKMLESTLLSEIISEVSVRVKVTSSDEPLTFRELSEGEQQLLTVLGLLKFTGGRDSLFLLDEPDTHLNPAWAVKYLTYLREFVEPNDETSHLLMVTHHPLAIAELDKKQIQVMWQDESNQVHAQAPAESPRGMGYGGILTSDMFGLRSTLDNPTEDLLRERRSLVELDQLTAEQRQELKSLDAKIESLGFTTAHWDKDYQEYLQIRKKMDTELFAEEEPSPDVSAKRKAKAQEILQRILEKERLGTE